MSFVGTQKKMHILEEMVEMELHIETIAIEGVVIQNEEEIPLGAYETEAQPKILGGTVSQPKEVIPTPLETTDAKNKTIIPEMNEAICQTEEVSQFQDQSAIIEILEAELVQSQHALAQTRDEMVTMTEYQRFFKKLKTMTTT